MRPTRRVEVDAARDLLTRMDDAIRESITNGGEIDLIALAAILEQVMSDSARGPVVLYLAAYLSRCLAGTIPDYRLWIPPL